MLKKFVFKKISTIEIPKSSKLHCMYESVRSKVVSIDKSRFERRQESVQSVNIELIYQICVKIFSFAVDKRTKNNLCMH